ncbi:Rho guanine nucleotide exchange factor scd1 [Fusarium odoratissimum]|uniref:Rho guanine nucleotide exchange factor scd1 n=1 Tax=Fusarium oxysporum f. sp. cubense (strain race 4) TaxID=2502994 RepID=N1RT17_FUSC4|nr:Rho guanine nucleotide exchange factor scd1 [Fusarium odoratissimum]
MSDPLSVAASIAGLISITVEAVKFLSPYVSAAKETPQVAAHVYSEVQSTQVILMGLQSLTKNLGLQSFKSSMTLVLMILQSDSGETAKEHQEQLSNNVKVLLDSNDALSRRLMNIEDALDAQTIISRRMSILSLSASPSQNTSQQSTAASPATSISTDTSLAISKFDFEDDLESSRVYRRAVRETMDFSFRSSIARSHNWSVFSGLSLGDISIMSVIALPVYQDDITNAEHYDFGEEAALNGRTPGPVMDQPLLIECLEIKLKLLTIPGMQRYFDEIPHPLDDFFHLWKELVLWFAQFCHDRLDIETSNLITVQDLMWGNEYGIFRVISLISSITKNLVITGLPMNDLSSAKAQVDVQPPEIRKLVNEQRQFVRDVIELLEIKDQLEMYMNPIFQGLRVLADVQIALLLIMEGNLLRPSADQEWASAFGYLFRYIEVEAASYANDKLNRTSIQLWLKEGHFRDKDKTRSLLGRCFDILPMRAKRISALFEFLEPIVTEEQKNDGSMARSSVSRLVVRLQDNAISEDTQAAVQKLQQKIEDWKGIDPDALGELILSKTLYVTKSSKTNLYHAYLFQNMLLLCKETRGEPTGERSFYRSKSLSEQKQTKFLLKGRFYLRHILSVTPTSQHVESEMRIWASKIDEYRMMAILMVKPKRGPEEMDLSIERNTDEPEPEGLTERMEPWKRYGVIK